MYGQSGIIPMWKNLSLRTRLSLPMVVMVLAALALGGVAVEMVSPDQFKYENEQETRSTEAVAAALNATLAASANPEATLQAFVRGLGQSESIQFRLPTPDKPLPRATGNL